MGRQRDATNAARIAALLGIVALGCNARRDALAPPSTSAPASPSRPGPSATSETAPDAVDGSPAGAADATSTPDAGAAPSDIASVSSADASSEDVPPLGSRVPYRAIAVTTGEVHACALLDDHNVKCWGDNSAGQLGLEDARGLIGRSPSEMGDALPVVNLGTGRTALAIAASRYATCAVLDNGFVKCWGWGD